MEINELKEYLANRVTLFNESFKQVIDFRVEKISSLSIKGLTEMSFDLGKLYEEAGMLEDLKLISKSARAKSLINHLQNIINLNSEMKDSKLRKELV